MIRNINRLNFPSIMNLWLAVEIVDERTLCSRGMSRASESE